MMSRLQQLNPELAEIVRKTLRTEGILPPGQMDEIPF